jgi:hypothetical protein
VTIWTLTDFIFNPAVIFVTLGRGLMNLSFVFTALPLIYLFATTVYPSLRPPGIPDSKFLVFSS